MWNTPKSSWQTGAGPTPTGDGIVEKNGIKAEFTCLYGSRRFRPSGCGYGGGGAASGRGHSDECGGHQLGRHFQAYVLQRGTHGLGAPPIPTKATACTTAAMRCGTTTTTPRGYSSPVTDGYLEAAMEALDTETAYQNWKLAQWDGSTGTSMKGQCPLGLDCQCTACVLRPRWPGHRPPAAPSPRRLHAPAQESQGLDLDRLSPQP